MTINKGKTNEELVNRYKARLKAREQEPIEEPLEEKLPQGDNGLVYAIDKSKEEDRSTIFLYREDQEDRILGWRTGKVNTFCIHQGDLLDAGDYNDIYPTSAPDKKTIRVDGSVNALCSQTAALFAAIDFGIYNLSNEKLISKRGAMSRALCVHNGQLYSAGDYDAIYDTLFSRKAIEVNTPVVSLCSHNGELYDVRRNGIMYHSTSATEEKKCMGDKILIAFSHNEELCDVRYIDNLLDKNSHGVFKTKNDENIFQTDQTITAICSISPEIVKKILEK
ncbi:hypothetical protein GOV06_04135 [Candidatus Woesearchaeota archaeon]|nr:hypothetical protein [Candidatus Woesearchaeota archaeon]